MRVTSLAALSRCSYIWGETEPRPKMDHIRASDARRYLSRVLDPVGRRESLSNKPHGKPLPRRVRVPCDSTRARQVAARIIERREPLNRVPVADQMMTIRQEHRH